MLALAVLLLVDSYRLARASNVGFHDGKLPLFRRFYLGGRKAKVKLFQRNFFESASINETRPLEVLDLILSGQKKEFWPMGAGGTTLPIWNARGCV